MNLIDRIKVFFKHGSERSLRMKKNILVMFLLKGGSILISFLLVPLTLDYVDSETYGIWLVLSSMVAWLHFFDVGLNNGLRNRLTEALAVGDYELGRKYVSTTYFILMIIFVPIMVIALIVAPYVDWNSVLNLTASIENLLVPVSIIIAYFCLNFILSTINTIILAEQRPADASLRAFIQQLTSLIIIWLLTKLTVGNLTLLCIGLCVSPLIVVSLFNITLFSGRYKRIAPSMKYIDFKVAPNLLKLGIQFFIIQVAGIIQYQMVNFLIIRNYSATDVTAYNISYKYFSVIAMVWGIMMTPVWSAVADACARNDYDWIKNMQKKYLKLFSLLLLAGGVMLIASPWAYKIWIGNKVEIPFVLSFWVFVYNIMAQFGGIFIGVLNGASKLKIQTIACLFSPIVFLGCFWAFKGMNWGVYSIIVASIIANFNGILLAPVQCYYLLRQKNS